MNQLIATNQSQSGSSTQSGSSINPITLFKPFLNLEGIGLIVLLLVLVLAGSSSSKGKITTGKKAGKGELIAATSLALKQIKERKHNKVCLWCGTPQYWWKGNQLGGKVKGALSLAQTIIGNSPTVWIPHAERGTLVLGAPGGGKTFGSINPMTESCLRQGFPMLFYARKEEEMEYIAPLAAKYGYDVKIFAPGEKYSEVINPLDFMRDAEDQEMAEQIAEVMNGNAKSGGKKSGGDDFFEKAGNTFAKGLIQLAKSSKHPDLATVYCLQAINSFTDKLDATIQEGKIPRWIAASFLQYLDAKDSEKTIASIKATTANIFAGFIQKSLLPCFMGSSTISTKLKGKQIIIFKLDDARRDVVGPLLAAAFHLTVVSNLSTPRSDPIGIIIDELPSLFLKALARWINEYRSNGACFVLGVQNIKQLADAYGENQARAIIGACSTKILYNPADLATAEEFSKIYGNTEVKLRNRSISHSNNSQNTTWSESLSTVAILTPDQIMRLPQGRCVITNPGYSSGNEGSIPYMVKIPIPAKDIKRNQQCRLLWNEKLRDFLVERSPQCHDAEKLDEALELRELAAQELLSGTPKPKEERIVTPPATEKKRNY